MIMTEELPPLPLAWLVLDDDTSRLERTKLRRGLILDSLNALHGVAKVGDLAAHARMPLHVVRTAVHGWDKIRVVRIRRTGATASGFTHVSLYCLSTIPLERITTPAP